ncbi:hypothetical protein CWE12_09890 [Aliidiomarina sedimenti]|uniref:diguanylate cyclase n=1 Tax=Aliidiomarina sedimenti TaxID=1933879 RepID=A0ABY0BXU4_9GAMM|nr:GGDEF domain-containing protein [Aliidiomarina sedimenti]RUO29285.1 hypothetical protein CWE12_09890 [Aliidiomarina sedimenti]
MLSWTNLRSWSYITCLYLWSLGLAQALESGTDSELEAQLDAIIEVGFYPPDRDAFNAILDSLDPAQTPLDSYVRAKAYQAFQAGLRDGDMDQAFAILAELETITDQRGSEHARFEVLASESHLLLEVNDMSAAMTRIPQLQTEVERVTNPRLRFFGFHLIARILKQNSQYDEALQYFVKSYDEVGREDTPLNRRRRIFINLNMARLHAELRNDETALEIASDAIAYAKEVEIYTRLPDLYLVQGFVQGQEGPSQQALESYTQATEWAERLDDDRVRLIGRNNAGSMLIMLERFDEAKAVLNEGVALSKTLNRESDAEVMRFNLGYIEVAEGRAEQGLATMETALENFRSNGRRAEVADWLSYLAEAYEMAGAYQRQAQTLIEQRQLREEIFRSERDRVISELHLRFETEQQNRRIEMLRQRSELQQGQLENQRLHQRIVVLGVIVVVLAALTLWLAYRSTQRANAKLNQANRELQVKSTRDPLTGLFNRRSLQEFMAQHSRLPGEKDALFLIDIDFFKQINDRQGHAAGDLVLTELASRLRSVCRDSDLVVRWGGEEFLIFLRNTSVEALPEFSRRLLQAVAGKPVQLQDQETEVTATAGLITLPLAGHQGTELDWEHALQIADLLLYYGKSHGRNQVNGVIGITTQQHAEVEAALYSDISKAIDNDWVELIQVVGAQRTG